MDKIKEATDEINIQTLKEGDGKTFPMKGENVEVHYVGKFLDGMEFDSSVRRDATFRFDLG